MGYLNFKPAHLWVNGIRQANLEILLAMTGLEEVAGVYSPIAGRCGGEFFYYDFQEGDKHCFPVKEVNREIDHLTRQARETFATLGVEIGTLDLVELLKLNHKIQQIPTEFWEGLGELIRMILEEKSSNASAYVVFKYPNEDWWTICPRNGEIEKLAVHGSKDYEIIKTRGSDDKQIVFKKSGVFLVEEVTWRAPVAQQFGTEKFNLPEHRSRTLHLVVIE